MNKAPPDEHLRQALRHAPDAQLIAPSELSAQIVAAAHRSVAAPPPPAASPLPGWRRWLAWPVRSPGTSAALASVVLAGFIGLLWRGETPGPAVDEAPRRIAQAAGAQPTQASPAAAVADAAPAVPASSAGMTPAVVRRTPANQQSGQAVAPPPPVAATRRATGNAGQQPGPVLRTQPAEIAPVIPDPPAVAEPVLKAESLAKHQQASPTASPPEPASSPRVAAAAPPPTASIAAPAGRSLRAAPGVAPATGAATAAREAVSPLTAADTGSRAPWQAAEMAAHQWRWQPQSALRSPDRGWWESLAHAARGRWQAAADARPVAGSIGLEGSSGTEPAARLWIEPASVLWCGEAPPCQRAPLAAESRRALLESLAR